MKRLHVMHSKRQALVMRRRSCAPDIGQIVVIAVTSVACAAVAWAATWVYMELFCSLS